MGVLDWQCSNCGATITAGQPHGCYNVSGSRGANANAAVSTSQVDPGSVAEVAAEATSDAKTKNFRGLPMVAQGQGNFASP